MSRTATAVAVSLLLVTAGCAGFFGDGTSAKDTGTVAFYVSDQPNAIDDFEHLNVTISEVAFHPANASENESWVTRDVDNRTVDLTRLQGENASLVGNLSVPTGEYDKVFVHVSGIEATLDSGEAANVKLPSEKLQLSTQFTVAADETVSFVYDVTVQQTGSGKYILKPQAAESGTDKPINRVDGGPKKGEDKGKQGGQQTTTTTTAEAKGSLGLYLSDQPNAIDDFRHLNVTITEVGIHAKNASGEGSWLTYEMNETTADLTRLQGDNATLLGNLSVPAGEYTKVFIHVSSIGGTLKDGSQPPVKLPSQKLQLSKPFTVEANESLSFVYDVGVHETGSGKYIVKPQVGKSGPDKPIKRVGQKQQQKRGGKQGGEQLALSFVGNVTRGENVTVRVTRNDSAVGNATVTVEALNAAGETISEQTLRTDANGEVTFSVPENATKLEIAANADGDTGELEHEFESSQG